MATCWVLYAAENEPDSCSRSVSVWATEEAAEGERQRLNAKAEPLREEAHALYEAKTAFEERGGYSLSWYNDKALRSMADAYFASVKAFEESEGTWFEPSSYRPRDDNWQPTFELKELPWNPTPEAR